MNKKGKNKKGHKPVNVQPEIQTEECKTVVLEEKVESVIPQVESEIVTEPVESKEDVPKKPKRSKGKKNKDNNEIDADDKEDAQIIPGVVEIKADNTVENLAEDKLDVLPIIPSARKKKNKKKGNQTGDTVNQTCDISQENVNIETAVTAQPEPETIDDAIAESEFKSPKKKNKKKKRNDSEKSDKEAVISCTTAFQNMEMSVEKSADKSEENKEPMPQEQQPIKIDAIEVKDEKTEILLPVSIEPIDVILRENEDKFKTEHKSKKKNKKDKKAQLMKTEEPHIEGIVSVEENTEKIYDETTTTAKGETKCSEESSKSKTKIVKVDDSLKHEPCAADDDNVQTKTQKNTQASQISEKFDTKEEIIEIPDSQPKITSKSVDTLNNPEKKRKKGRKSPKPSETEIQTLIEISHGDCDIETAFADKTVTIAEADQVKIDKSKTELLTPTNIELSTSLDQIVDKVLEPEKVIQPKLEAKPLKKRKKSPRPVRSEDGTKTTQPIVEQTSHKQEAATSSREKTEIPIATPRLDELEIRSLTADESEGSACDFTPEILYPRATSQQLLDNNNNMVIREIFTTEQNISSPVSPSSIDIPTTPQTSRKFQISEQIEKDGKTDLKSKMMEVNKDMEGLRRSIEKSLAEFTAMEKAEEKVEKQYENTKQKKDETLKINTDDKQEITKSENKETISASEAITVTGDNQVKHLPEISSSTYQFTANERDLPMTPSDVTKLSEVISEKSSRVEPQNVDMQIPQEPVIVSSTEDSKLDIDKQVEIVSAGSPTDDEVPVCPSRKDQKGKQKKKKGKQESNQTTSTTPSSSSTTTSTSQSKDKQDKKEEKDKAQSNTKGQGKQQSSEVPTDDLSDIDYEPIENFEDALTSSVDDVNKTFEIMMNESNEQTNPTINITAPDEEKKTTVTPSKNLLGHPNIPVRSSKRDYKKEKDKIPNDVVAKVNIHDGDQIEKKQSKNTQTIKKMIKESAPEVNDNDEFVYKYSFRKVFLQCACHVCKKDLSKNRVPCGYCNLMFYCSVKHKDEDWAQHQALCFAVSTLVHLKDQKHIYADTKGLSGHEYRLARMQMIVSCEKVLKRRLVPWEQEALLYPRMCANVDCREWRQGKLQDCDGCGQISYCSEKPDHLPKSHQRWCKSYSLYQKLVCYQQTKGRLEPRLPTKVMADQFQIPEKMNEVLASIYEEKIDMNDIQYAALTQIATAPLTAAYAHQIYASKTGKTTYGVSKKSSCTIHVVGAELQFEADALNKWEVFFLHLRPELQELRVVLINYNLNPSNLPLDLLGKVKLCENCRVRKRRVTLAFQDKSTYSDYKSSEDFIHPDLICTFNPSIQRSSIYNGQDPWPSTIKAITKLRAPFLLTAYTMTELQKDALRIREFSENPTTIVSEAKFNNFASVRPDRNFISDDEMPLLFKNYCCLVMCGN